MNIVDNVLDFTNQVKSNPYHMKDNDTGDFVIKKLIKLSDNFYIQLYYSGHFESYYEELKNKGNYSPMILYSLFFLKEGQTIESVVKDHDYVNRFDFGETCLKNYISAIDENHGKIIDTKVLIHEGPFERSYLGFYPDSDDVALTHIDYEEEAGLAKVVLLTSNVVLELYEIFKILSSFNFYLDKLNNDDDETCMSKEEVFNIFLDAWIKDNEDNIVPTTVDPPIFKMKKIGSGAYTRISATWNKKEYLPTHQIVKKYNIKEEQLKELYKNSEEYSCFTADDVVFVSVEFLNKMNLKKK